MIALYFLIGMLAAMIGALPLGASNIAVINTTLKEDATQAFKIAVTAAIAEVLVSLFALHCSMAVKGFAKKNEWLQIVIILLFVAAGIYLFFKKQKKKQSKDKSSSKSKYLSGFLTGVLNPPVLIYWIIAIGMINAHDYMLTLESSLTVLFLFFFGVYAGKLLTLYLYSRFSALIKDKVSNIKTTVNKITGVLLLVIAVFQTVKLYLG